MMDTADAIAIETGYGVDQARRRPLITGIGGTPRAGSTSEQALRYALGKAAELGCDTEIVPLDELILPIFDPGNLNAMQAADPMLTKVRAADGLLIATPGYHGSMSGLIKNALDYFEAMAKDSRPYLHGRAVGCIATASGWQAGVTTLSALRATVHALRGWTAPRGVVVNSSERPFEANGTPRDEVFVRQTNAMVEQVVEFSQNMRVY